jgi:hypothetical protein
MSKWTGLFRSKVSEEADKSKAFQQRIAQEDNAARSRLAAKLAVPRQVKANLECVREIAANTTIFVFEGGDGLRVSFRDGREIITITRKGETDTFEHNRTSGSGDMYEPGSSYRVWQEPVGDHPEKITEFLLHEIAKGFAR